MGKGQWQFEGGAFHESLPEGRSAGTLEVSPVSVKFVSEAGTVEMPVSGLQMELGGAANRMLFLKHPEHSDWTFFTTDHAWSVVKKVQSECSGCFRNSIRLAAPPNSICNPLTGISTVPASETNFTLTGLTSSVPADRPSGSDS